jgi:hypothetical protein
LLKVQSSRIQVRTMPSSNKSRASTSGQRTTSSPPRATKSPSPPGPAREKSKSPSPPPSYDVYRVEYLGQPNHVAIFVETHEDGQKSGVLYHVTGNILAGMTYERKLAKQPEQSATYEGKTSIGTISAAKYSQVNGICQSVPVPGRQLKLNGQRINPNVPLRRCGEWVDDAINLLRARGVLKN